MKRKWHDTEKRLFKKPLRDPGIEEVVDKVNNYSTSDIYHNSYLSRSTIRKLRRTDDKATRRPQHMTLTGVLNACGYEYAIRRMKKPDGR